MKLVLSTESSLIGALGTMVPGASMRTLRQMLAQGRVRLNGRIVKIASEPASAGDVVEIFPAAEFHPPVAGLAILYEDKDILLIEKPPGLLSVATPHERTRTAYAFMRSYVKGRKTRRRLFIVHRLDKFASGILVFAKSETVQAILKNTFSRHDIQRKYWAIVEGRVKEDRGTIRSFLAQNQAGRMHSTGDIRSGKEAVTHFKVLRRFPQLTSLEITLETGRKNQIRVHLSELGHPIVGDKAYHSEKNPMGRMGLHAFLLAFRHPTLGTPVVCRTAIPSEFVRYLPKSIRFPHETGKRHSHGFRLPGRQGV